MKLHVELLPSGERKIMKFADAVNGFDVVDALGLKPDAYLLVRDGRPIPMDESLRNGDRIKLIKVASGG
ncbi:MAG: MoaD/ThiS family protein [Thermoplasmata archaeon]